jgi:hypothetical protein
VSVRCDAFGIPAVLFALGLERTAALGADAFFFLPLGILPPALLLENIIAYDERSLILIIAPNCIWKIIVVVASCPYSDVTSPPPPIKYYLR